MNSANKPAHGHQWSIFQTCHINKSILILYRNHFDWEYKFKIFKVFFMCSICIHLEFPFIFTIFPNESFIEWIYLMMENQKYGKHLHHSTNICVLCIFATNSCEIKILQNLNISLCKKLFPSASYQVSPFFFLN